MKIIYQIKATFFITLIISMSLLMASCEKVIEIDLNSSNPILAADGKMELDSTAWIKLSYTTDYFDIETPIYLEDATVIISNSKDESEVLVYEGEGMYIGQTMRGEANETYTISIEDELDIFMASAELYGPPEIIELSFAESFFFNPHSGKISYSPTIKFVDDPAVKNYYMVKIWKNDTIISTRYTSFEDTFFNINDTISYSPFAANFDLYDEIVVKVYSIDEETDKYYNQLNDNQGGGPPGGTPYNPRSNFGYKVLGYFTASSYDEIEAVVILEE